MKELLDKSIVKGFFKFYEDSNNLKDYKTYYSKLAMWTRDNLGSLSEELLENYRLDILLDIVPQQYVIRNPEIALNMEKTRMEAIEFETADELAMTIGNTLWDMVTYRTGKECPICIDDELRYIMTKNRTTKTEKMALECETCGWTEKLDGTKWDEGRVDVLPANCNDLMKNGILV